MTEQFDRDKWCKEHPILKMVIPFYSEEAEKKKKRAKMLEKIEQNSLGDEDGAI